MNEEPKSGNCGPSTSGTNSKPSEPSGSVTQVVEATEVDGGAQGPVLKLRLKKELRKKVSWTSETVDNENLGKKKSKCCCIYVKPKTFGESDTESDDSGAESDCEHCTGHKGKSK